MSAAGGLDRVLRRWRGRAHASPSLLPLSPVAWYRSWGAANTDDGSGRLSVAVDLSGNGHDLPASPASNRLALGTSTAFGGSRTVWVASGGQYAQSAAWTTQARPYTILCVARVTTVASFKFIADSAASSPRNALYVSSLGPPVQTTFFDGGSASASYDPSAATVYVIQQSADKKTTVRANGAQVASATLVGGGVAGVTLGAQYSLASGVTGEIVEWALVPGAVGADVEEYARKVYPTLL